MWFASMSFSDVCPAGAVANRVSGAGNTPLMLAAGQGTADVVGVLISGGVPIDAKNGNGDTALMLAARAGHINVVRSLLAAGADASLRNQKRERAQSIAASAGHSDIAALIAERAASKKSILGLF